ncbi:MAG: hypothetical protein WC770_05530 [Phycisphaerae bacterium]|jgi:hypothetical protein
MDEMVVLKLPRDFVGQILDCLEIAIEDWHRTKLYHKDGIIDPDEPYIRECTDAHEAGQIEAFYEKIKTQVKKQLDKQS